MAYELAELADRNVTHAKIAKTLRNRRLRGLSKAGQVVKRLPYPEKTLTDYRIESGMTLEEIWYKLIREKAGDPILGIKPDPGAYAPEHHTSIIWTEKHGSDRMPVVRAFAKVFEKPEAEIEAALLVPKKYKDCATIAARWDHAKRMGYKVTHDR